MSATRQENHYHFQITLDHIRKALDEYDRRKGMWRQACKLFFLPYQDQEDMGKLRDLYTALTKNSRNVNGKLTLKEAYQFLSILVRNKTKDDSLSSEVISTLENYMQSLLNICCMLDRLKAFTLDNFIDICMHGESIANIHCNILNLVDKIQASKPNYTSYIRILCSYSHLDLFMPEVVAYCKVRGLDDEDTLSMLMFTMEGSTSNPEFSKELLNRIQSAETTKEIMQLAFDQPAVVAIAANLKQATPKENVKDKVEENVTLETEADKATETPTRKLGS